MHHSYNFGKQTGNPIRGLIHGWTHRRTGTQLICDAVILALAAIALDFLVLFTALVVDAYAIESEPPALISGLGTIIVRVVAIGAVVVGGIGFVRFAREGADTMDQPKRDAIPDALPAPKKQRDAA